MKEFSKRVKVKKIDLIFRRGANIYRVRLHAIVVRATGFIYAVLRAEADGEQADVSAAAEN